MGGITVDSSGNIYVAETNDGVIQKFNSNGTYIAQWGSAGDGNGQFSGVYGLDVDADDNVYAADNGNYRVQKFDSDGTYISKLGADTYGYEDGEFSGPRDVAIDYAGNIYVADSGGGRIQKFDPDGNFITKWGYPDDSYFYYPQEVAVDAAGNVYIGDIDSDGFRFNILKFAFPAETAELVSSTGSDLAIETAENVSISCADTAQESSLAEQDTDYQYPLELVDFCLTVPSFGATTTVTLTFETDLSPAEVVARKYSAETEVYRDVPGATITETTLNSNPALQLTYDITDGGDLDDDGIANGEILDPVGLAVASNSDSESNGSLADTGQNGATIVGVAVAIITFGLVLGFRYNYHKN